MLSRGKIRHTVNSGCDATCVTPKRGNAKRAKRQSSKKLRQLLKEETTKEN